MKRLSLVVLTCLNSLQALHAACVDTHNFTLDEHGNGLEYHYFTGPLVLCTNTVAGMPYQVTSDPTGGVTNRPVLIYSSPSGFLGMVGGGDVLMISTNSLGSNVIAHVIRFLGELDPDPSGRVIIYAADNSGSLADKGIPTSFSANAVQITDHPGGATFYSPSSGQPGYPDPFASSFASYSFSTEPVSPVFVLSTNKISLLPDGFGGVILSWSTNATNFALFQSTNIFRATNWTRVTNDTQVSGDQKTVTLPGPLLGARFFRLIQQ